MLQHLKTEPENIDDKTIHTCLGIWPKLLMNPIVAVSFSGSFML